MPAKLVVSTRAISHKEWLSWRRKGVGGSDAAAICGVDRWKTAMEVYLDKIGELPETEVTESARFGGKLKDFIAREFSEATGFKVMRRNWILQHREHPFMLATIDRWIIGSSAGLLCKTTGEFLKDEWKDGRVPDRVAFQCQHYMAVTGADHWWVAVLIGGNKFRTVRLERDDNRIEQLIKTESSFWNEHVLPRTPPSFDGTEASASLLKRMYPAGDSPGTPLKLPGSAEEWIRQYLEGTRDEKEALARKKEAENVLKGLLGTSEQGILGSYKVEWKSIHRKSGRHASYRRFDVVTMSN
ncbi:YqaJ viral recombinase family protein [Paenibacillus sp. FJAT-26967]|uniref:YqaJ viral recombinase family nuclease n=1 Tax=Paenibacillus sp. FJAT-26967 TaxID=1729690 RepID=UPI0008394FD3|nr:YqaJ viral recombinase family protein [Paenibacillus sp. FJAT-26967]